MSKTNQAPPPTLAGAFGRLGARLLPEQALRGTTTTSAGNAGTALSNEGMEYVPGTPSGLKGHPLPIRWKSDVNKTPGDELNIDKQPPRRPLRDADPLPTTLAEAYESLGPRAVGNTTLGRLIGTPNNSGFIELTPEMQQEIAGVWSDDMMSPTNVVPYDKSIFEGTPVAFSPSEVPVSFDYGDLKLTSGIDDHVMPGLTPKTGLQALRADEESQGLLYASGKYWAENADGKLEAIPSDLINGEGTARQQAIAFMQSKKQPIIEAIQDEVQPGIPPDQNQQDELSRALAQHQAWEKQQLGHGPNVYAATEGPVTLESFQPYATEHPMDAQGMFYQYQDLHGDHGKTKADAFAIATGQRPELSEYAGKFEEFNAVKNKLFEDAFPKATGFKGVNLLGK